MQLPATAGKILLEDEALFDFRRVEQPPTRGAVVLRVHRVPQLENQQPLDSLVDSVVVWLGHSHAAAVADLDQMLVRDCVSQTIVEWL